LPFPKNLEDSVNLRIAGFERNKMGEYIGRALNSGMGGASLGDSTVRDIPKLIQELGRASAIGLSGASGGEGASGLLGGAMEGILNTKLSNMVGSANYFLRSRMPGTLGSTIDNITGQTVNPRETLAFEGVDLKTHSFSWELYPSNKEDSELIKSIVKRIKQNALPTTQDIAGIKRAFLQYPSTVDTYLLGVDPEHFIKYKTSMITDFSIDYGAGGIVAIAKGGKPAAVRLSMNIMELEIETADDHGVEPVVVNRPAQTDNAPSVNSGGPGFREGQ